MHAFVYYGIYQHERRALEGDNPLARIILNRYWPSILLWSTIAKHFLHCFDWCKTQLQMRVYITDTYKTMWCVHFYEVLPNCVNCPSVGYLNASVSAFSASCVRLWEEVQRVTQDGSPSENTVRIIIDKYMNIERAFIRPEGLPGRPYFKWVFYHRISNFNLPYIPGYKSHLILAFSIISATYSAKVNFDYAHLQASYWASSVVLWVQSIIYSPCRFWAELQSNQGQFYFSDRKHACTSCYHKFVQFLLNSVD